MSTIISSAARKLLCAALALAVLGSSRDELQREHAACVERCEHGPGKDWARASDLAKACGVDRVGECKALRAAADALYRRYMACVNGCPTPPAQ